VLRLLPFAGLAAALLSVGNAVAAPTARLVYSRASGAESCADEVTLRRAVAARVGYDPFFPWAKRTVVAELTRQSRAFVATVSLVDEQGVAHGGRALRTSGACAELLDATALTIAIAIDPEILTHPPAPPVPVDEPAPPPAPAAVAPSIATAPLENVPTPAPPRPATSQAAFEASLGAVASNGDAPDIAVGLSAGVQVRWRHASFGIEGRVDAPAARSAQGKNGGDVSAWPLLGAVVPCAYFGAFLACAVGQAGALRVSGAGVSDPQTKWMASWQVGARVGILLPVAERISLRVRSDLLVDVDRASLGLRGIPVWTAPLLGSSLGIDAVLRFR
jgi:hypothetical protein